jgi:hypothetical protein
LPYLQNSTTLRKRNGKGEWHHVECGAARGLETDMPRYTARPLNGNCTLS